MPVSPDYEKTISVRSAPGAIFDALTQTHSLTAWWTPATGSAEAGGDIVFAFEGPLLMHVDQATRASSVRWTVLECDFLPDWVGTRPTFTITPVDDETSELHFRHEGLTAELDCIDMCIKGWNHFIVSLGRYAETGLGMPNGSPGDQARRTQSA